MRIAGITRGRLDQRITSAWISPAQLGVLDFIDNAGRSFTEPAGLLPSAWASQEC